MFTYFYPPLQYYVLYLNAFSSIFFCKDITYVNKAFEL